MTKIKKAEFNAFGQPYSLDLTEYVRKADGNIYLKEKDEAKDAVGDYRLNINDNSYFLQYCNNNRSIKGSGDWSPIYYIRNSYIFNIEHIAAIIDYLGDYLYFDAEFNAGTFVGTGKINMYIYHNSNKPLMKTTYRLTAIDMSVQVNLFGNGSTDNEFYSNANTITLNAGEAAILEVEKVMNKTFAKVTYINA